MVFDAGQGKDGYCRDDNKRQQYRPKPLPSHILPQSPHNDSRGGDGQQTRKCRSFTVCRQEKRQHRHDEDAKTEARGALHKAGSYAQQEYGYHDTTHNMPVSCGDC